MPDVVSLDPRASGAPPWQTFAAEADRRRLTAPALKALVRLMAAWRVTNEQAAALLGVSPSTWDRIRYGRWNQTLSQDQFMRASALIGIFKGLHLLFIDELADDWPTLRNRGPLFENLTPVESMIEGGIPQMLDVRGHVDALRGGL
ncbi:MAG TPA: antitoxin Xre-like helix-turn-helix domain-containing protein [Thalassobaculum sp.]